jgi:RNA polymerase sigma factor (TIGR02999 family)
LREKAGEKSGSKSRFQRKFSAARHTPIDWHRGDGPAILLAMSEVTRILSQIEQGDSHAAEELLPLIYNELRRLAAAKLAQEKPGQTLQATALVHDAYIRLVDVKQAQHWESRGHFYAAAAEAMRRILVESARRKGRVKRGAGMAAIDLGKVEIPVSNDLDEVLAIDEALNKLDAQSPVAAQLVKLRYFAGFTIPEAADVLGISSRKADQVWAYARSWLLAELGEGLPR